MGRTPSQSLCFNRRFTVTRYRPTGAREAQTKTSASVACRCDQREQDADHAGPAEDISDPSALVARLTSGTPVTDDIDQAIEDLLNDDTTDRPQEG